MSGAIRIALVLYLASSTLSAQTPGKDVPSGPLEGDCPIVVHATLDGRVNRLPIQRLQVTLSQRPASAIVAARVTVHGIAGGLNHSENFENETSVDLNKVRDPRPVGSPGSLPPIWQPHPTGDFQGVLPPLGLRIIIKSASSRSSESRWYAWVSGFSAVNFVDVESVSYADGTTWHVVNGKTCRVSVGQSVW
jgi:hypothetical protein